MTKRVELPGGQWAEVRTRQELTEGQRRTIEGPWERLRAAPGVAKFYRLRSGLTEDQQDDLLVQLGIDPGIFNRTVKEANDVRIVTCVAEWSYDQPITLDGLLEIPGDRADTYDALLAEVVGIDTPVEFRATPEVDSPTSPSPNSGEG